MLAARLYCCQSAPLGFIQQGKELADAQTGVVRRCVGKVRQSANSQDVALGATDNLDDISKKKKDSLFPSSLTEGPELLIALHLKAALCWAPSHSAVFTSSPATF